MSRGHPQIRRQRVCHGAVDGLLRVGGKPTGRTGVRGHGTGNPSDTGDGLLAFRRHANGVLDPAKLLEVLQEGKEVRPDLYQTWSALMWQLADMGRVDEAVLVAEEASRRFPMVPSTWYDLGFLHHIRGDEESAKATLRHILDIAPHFTAAEQQLATYFQKDQDYSAAREILERAVVHAPLERDLHCQLAEVLWYLGEKNAAVERVKRAILIDPNSDESWARLQAWALDMNRPELPGAFAEQLTVDRPGNAACWLALATVLAEPEHLPAADRG